MTPHGYKRDLFVFCHTKAIFETPPATSELIQTESSICCLRTPQWTTQCHEPTTAGGIEFLLHFASIYLVFVSLFPFCVISLQWNLTEFDPDTLLQMNCHYHRLGSWGSCIWKNRVWSQIIIPAPASLHSSAWSWHTVGGFGCEFNSSLHRIKSGIVLY